MYNSGPNYNYNNNGKGVCGGKELSKKDNITIVVSHSKYTDMELVYLRVVNQQKQRIDHISQ